jgi:maltooligosyltrehalose trehalohydrolase
MSSRPTDHHRSPLGATLVDDGVEFRVWAPTVHSIGVELEDRAPVPLALGEDGVWSAIVRGIGAGTRYRFHIDDRWGYPDPYSRSQPEGPRGPSEVVDPAAYAWRDADWHGLTAKGLSIYELHVGAYTPEGTFDALARELDALAALGVNALELMPIAEFPGTRNWGYDGVDLFAPSHIYGGPAALKRLVNAAHARGLGVILDVVYNHLGPDGNFITQFSTDYFSNRHETRWGDGINYDGPNNEMVRRFFIDNACYWLQEYHIDGLRIDAAFTIVDDSERHILEELATAARASVAPARGIVMIAETYENDTKYVRAPADGGFGFDAVWADDFHHVVHAMASHERGGYYQDYAGTLDELARTINHGWLFEGQESKFLGIMRGTSAGDLPAEHFLYCMDNHDQAANRAFGRRLSYLVGVEQHRAWSGVMLLLPYTPMIFMGQEFAASTGFFYFTDHGPDLGEAIRVGRHAEFAAHEHPEEQARRFPDPQDPRMFEDSKLRLEERDTGAGAGTLLLYSDLLRLRKDDGVLSRQDRHGMHAYAASETLLVVHLWHGREHRLIVANFGIALDDSPEHAHVTAPLRELEWTTVLSTDDTRFGGGGGDVRFDTELISMPANTVAWLAATAAAPAGQ